VCTAIGIGGGVVAIILGVRLSLEGRSRIAGLFGVSLSQTFVLPVHNWLRFHVLLIGPVLAEECGIAMGLILFVLEEGACSVYRMLIVVLGNGAVLILVKFAELLLL